MEGESWEMLKKKGKDFSDPNVTLFTGKINNGTSIYEPNRPTKYIK